MNSAAVFRAEAGASHSLRMGLKTRSAGVHNSAGSGEKLNLENEALGIISVLRVLGLKVGLTR